MKAGHSRGRAELRPRTLAIDVGGTHVKASVLDAGGKMIVPEAMLPTPHPAPPHELLDIVARLTEKLPDFERISAGFPGYVKRNIIHTAPNLDTEAWRGFALANALTERFGKPARVLNDADVQGLGVISGHGLECVLTLGTGIGSALFFNGRLLPHLELGQHPVWHSRTYDQYLGDAARRKKGRAKWNARLKNALAIVATLVNYDTLYLGGGNAMRIDFKLPEKAKIAANVNGITGGIRLWEATIDEFFTEEYSQRVQASESLQPSAATPVVKREKRPLSREHSRAG